MNKIDFYSSLANQMNALISGESDEIANMANISALLFSQLDDVNWAGFYLYKESQLVLGPFQGLPACIRIPMGKGVCGTCASTLEVQRVDDVHQFDGHIACDAASNSEIVIPVKKNNQLFGVLDIDSTEFSRFDEQDQIGLENLMSIFEESIQ